MFSFKSDGYESLLVQWAARNAVAESVSLIMNVGASAGDSTHAPHHGESGNGEKRLSTNLFHLKKCKEITTRMRNSNSSSAALQSPPPYVSILEAEMPRIDKYARVAEKLASSRLTPQTKFKDAATVIRSLMREGIHSDNIFEVLLALLKVQQASSIIVCGEVSVASVQLGLDLTLAYVLTHNTANAVSTAAEAQSCLKQISEPHPAKAHLKAKLLLAESLALLGAGEYRKARTKSKEAVDAAESLYTETTGLRWYHLVGALTNAASVGGGDVENTRLLDHCDSVLAPSVESTVAATAAGIGNESRKLLALLPLLKVHCSLLHRADVALRAPAVAHARKRLLDAVKNASTKADLELIEQRLKVEVALVDEKARNLKLTVVRQCEHITSICDLFLRRMLSSIGPENAADGLHHRGAVLTGTETTDVNPLAISGLVGVIGSRAAARVDRSDLALRFASTSDKILTPLLGQGHPLVVVNRISLGCSQLFRGQSSATPPTVLRALAQLSASAADVSTELMVRMSTDALAALDAGPLSPAEVIKALEETLGAIMASDTPFERDFGPLLSSVATLYNQYSREGEKEKAGTMLGLWAHALADLLGPQHPLTLSKLDAFITSRNVIAPPKMNPSGGVVPLLTRVEITDAPDCETFIAFDGETPTDAPGVNSSVHYNTHGPVVLDRVGTVILKAASFRDGKRSACAEARFVVQPL